MTITITLPDNYGYVILSAVLNTLIITPIYMGGPVMKARENYNVQYPNLYAVPGLHKEADAFNRIQRGHQNMFESLTGVSLMALIGGLKYPIACSIYALMYSTGCILYQIGYADTKLDVKTARYKKGGGLKWIGLFGAFGATVSVVGSLNKWW